MHDNNISPSFDAFIGSIPTASPSAYSAFQVVLDDGTLQKRTISLSTLPDEADLEQEQEQQSQEQEQETYHYNQLRKGR